jgi:hypothetical protein
VFCHASHSVWLQYRKMNHLFNRSWTSWNIVSKLGRFADGGHSFMPPSGLLM